MCSTKTSAAILASMKISKNRLQDTVYERLCGLILNGEIAAGQLITVQALSEALGVSMMPVREALLRLEAEQALMKVTGRSLGIPPLTEKRLEDMTRVRYVLEGTTAEWAVDNISSVVIDRLEQLQHDMEYAVEHQDAKSFLKLNRKFHFTIYKQSNSESACSIIEKFWLRILPYHHLYRPDRYARANSEHCKIINALKVRDRQGVGDGIREDILSGSRYILDEVTLSIQGNLDAMASVSA
jgi:DNA-binding GntR family transcriptional regulator